MPLPSTYTRQADFTDHSTNSPNDPHVGTDMDAEFDAIKTFLDGIRTQVDLLLRDDDEMSNGIVHRDALAAELYMGINTPVEWATATAFTIRDSVIEAGKWYYCAEAHTSGTFATDLAAVKWVEIFDFTTFISSLALSNTTPAAQVVSAGVIGSSTFAARADHVHPLAADADAAAVAVLVEAATTMGMSY